MNYDREEIQEKLNKIHIKFNCITEELSELLKDETVLKNPELHENIYVYLYDLKKINKSLQNLKNIVEVNELYIKNENKIITKINSDFFNKININFSIFENQIYIMKNDFNV